MKPLTIEKTYRKLSQNTVIEYRRIVTPWFYKNLKTKRFKKVDYCSPYCLGFLAPKPIFRYVYWEDEKGSRVTDKKIVNQLELTNEQANEVSYINEKAINGR
jgi:hypothetical protein